jgi:hypothetical protein
METLTAAAQCVAIAAATYAALFVIGWPLWTILGGHRLHLSAAAGAPIVGLGVLQAVAWYGLANATLATIAWITLPVGAFATVVTALWRRPWRQRRPAVRWSEIGSTALVVVGTAAVFVGQHANVFRRGTATTGEFLYPDLPNYALVGDHLRLHGLSGPGTVLGFDLSHFAMATVPGAFVLPGAVPAWLHIPTPRVMLPIALVAVTLLALVLRDLGRVVLPDRPLVAALVGLTGVSTALFVYIVGLYPLSELIAIPAAAALIVVLIAAAREPSRSTVLRAAAIGAFAYAVLLMTYPHMAILAPPVIGSVALASTWGRRWYRRFGAVVAAGSGVVAAAAVALPAQFIYSFSYASKTSEAQAGSVLQAIGPIGLLGFQPVLTNTSPTTNVLIGGGAIVLVVCGLAALTTARDERWRASLGAAAAIVPLVVYGVVFQVLGASYQQWKWMSFFVPLYVVGVTGLGAAVVIRAVGLPRLRRVLAVGSGVALVVVLSAQGAYAYQASHSFYTRGVTTWWYLDPNLRTIGSGPAYRGVGAVDVDLQGVWETIWAFQRLAPHPVTAQSPSIHPVTDPVGQWSLERADSPGTHPPGAEVRRVNSTYRLVRDVNYGVRPGDLWEVGDCEGLYRYDGQRWRAVDRTWNTGELQLRVTPSAEPVGTKAPLIVRRTLSVFAIDVMLLEYLPGNQARVVLEHRVTQFEGGLIAPKDHRHDIVARSVPFPIRPGTPTDLRLVMDPITGEASAQVGSFGVLSTTIDFFRPHRGYLQIGKNLLNHGGERPADARARFTGRIERIVTPAPVACAASRFTQRHLRSTSEADFTLEHY